MNLPYIDPNTRDYILSSGQIENRDSTLTRIYLRLFCPLGSYLFDKNFGCGIYNYLGASSTIVNKRTLEKSVELALQDMIVDGTLSYVKAICFYQSLTSAKIKLFYRDIFQQEYAFVWEVSQL